MSSCSKSSFSKCILQIFYVGKATECSLGCPQVPIGPSPVAWHPTSFLVHLGLDLDELQRCLAYWEGILGEFQSLSTWLHASLAVEVGLECVGHSVSLSLYHNLHQNLHSKISTPPYTAVYIARPCKDPCTDV